MQDSGHTATHVASNAVDGKIDTYWQGKSNKHPQSITIDLGSPKDIGKIVVKLPSGWSARSQRFSISGSTNGAGFTTIVASASYRFDPSSGNTVTITFSSARKRFVRLTFTANSGSTAGQAAEIQVYAA